jgi:1,4-dihydroxy-2-naphthoyl-CoA synthase
MVADVNGWFKGGGSSWSTMATIKIVRRAATLERTGEVREMRIRKEPENAAGC